MQTQSPAKARETTPRAIGSEELAEGLMLMRASTLKMIRLQLAMERRDRRVVLEEVDDLLAIDRRLQDYLDEVPELHEQSPLMHELEIERAALNREKLTLAAEVIRREPPPARPLPFVEEAPPLVKVEAPQPEVWGSFEFAQAEDERRHRGIGWLAILLILLLAVAGAAYMLADPQTLMSMAAWIGAAQ
jgi:hypothetical protein